MRVLVTGASGFIGEALCTKLADAGYDIIRATRQQASGTNAVDVGDIGPDTDWNASLQGMDTVVHLAARVHVMRDDADNPLEAFRRVNTQGTLRLAGQAVGASVKRLVYLSSIKVNGEGSDHPYNEANLPEPNDPYAISKWEAEQGLRDIAEQTGLEVVILRPPLVYGPGVKANFLSLMNAVRKGLPLPLGGIDNRRSLIYLGNLVDAIRVCIEHPDAANKTYLVSDGEDISTPELVRKLAACMGCPARLLPVPSWLVSMAGLLTGKREAIARLLGSLTLDSSAIRRELDWTPPFTLNEGLCMTVKG
jgi:nucleoside-diphosphate-sugar epimerase